MVVFISCVFPMIIYVCFYDLYLFSSGGLWPGGVVAQDGICRPWENEKGGMKKG